MRNKLTEIALVASILLALSFTLSCSAFGNEDDDVSSSSGKGGGKGSSSSNGNGFNENSQIYSYECGYYGDEEDWDCNVVAYTGNGLLYEWNLRKPVGTVTKGKVDMKLPSTIPEEEYEELFYFDDDDEDDFEEYCEEYTKGVGKYKARVDLRESNNGDGYIGDLYINDDNSYERVEYWYFSKDGKIKCNIYDELIFDLTFKKGWNPIYKKMTIAETEDNEYLYVDKSSTENILTKEVKWFLSFDSGD